MGIGLIELAVIAVVGGLGFYFVASVLWNWLNREHDE